jgi:hypothetical protein
MPRSICSATGCSRATGTIPICKELRNISKEEKHRYPEGLAKFHAEEIKEPLSYFQVAGKFTSTGPQVLAADT